MAVYLILARGPDAENATPILASSDSRVIGAALQAISHLGDQVPQFECPLMDYPTIGAGGEEDDEQYP